MVLAEVFFGFKDTPLTKANIHMRHTLRRPERPLRSIKYIVPFDHFSWCISMSVLPVDTVKWPSNRRSYTDGSVSCLRERDTMISSSGW